MFHQIGPRSKKTKVNDWVENRSFYFSLYFGVVVAMLTLIDMEVIVPKR